jgi:hypothetical protein
MFFRCVSVLLLASLAVGQATPAASPQTPAQAPAPAPAPSSSKPAGKTPADISPTTPVIVVDGVCDKAPVSKTAAAASKAKTPADCKTIITKAEFESLANALQPNMNASTKRMLADRYPKMLIFATAAHKRGLDASPDFKKVLQFYKMQILTQELAKSVKEKSEKIPEADIEKYYKDNPAEFEQATLQRLYIPKDKQVEAAGDKPEAKSADQQMVDQDALKKEADALHTRAAAGEDFDKLQKEAAQTAGMATDPNIKVEDLRRGDLSDVQNVIFDLQPGKISGLLTDNSGYFIYKLVSRIAPPFETVKPQVTVRMQNDKSASGISQIEKMSDAEVNSAYFDKYDPPPPAENEGDMDSD